MVKIDMAINLCVRCEINEMYNNISMIQPMSNDDNLMICSNVTY